MDNYVTITSDRNKKVAFWCYVLGGFLGIHQFYVGNIGKGILYFVTGLFMIGWFIDIIKIATGCFRDNTGAPLRK